MTLSIIVVAFNARADLERCITSLHEHPPAIAHDITIVDNGSSDGGPAAVVARWPGVRLVTLPANAGFAAGNNAGIRATTGDLILLLNSDTVVPAGAIDALVAGLERDPSAAAAGPRLVDAQGRPEISFGAMISPLAELRQKVLGRLYAADLSVIVEHVDRVTRTEQHVDWVSGACLLVRRADAEAAGLLDERYFLYTEDVDFCAALRALGRTILFAPAADVVHLRGRSRAGVAGPTQAAYRRSHVAFYEKHHPAWAPVLKAYLRLKGERLS